MDFLESQFTTLTRTNPLAIANWKHIDGYFCLSGRSENAPNEIKLSQALLNEAVEYLSKKGKGVFGDFLEDIRFCFNYYSCSIPVQNHFEPLPLMALPSAPIWVARGIAACVLNNSVAYVPKTPIVKEMFSFIKSEDGSAQEVNISTDRKYLARDSPLPISIAIVLEGSDLDAVVEMAAQTVISPHQFIAWKVPTVLVQESLEEELNQKLSSKFRRAVETGYWRKDDAHIENVKKIVLEAKKAGARVTEIKNCDDVCCSAIIHDLKPLKIELEPVLFVLPFRTADEAVKLAAELNHFCAASIWGDNISISLAVARKVDCNTVWLNSFGRTHPGVTVCSQPKCFLVSAQESCVPFLEKKGNISYLKQVKSWKPEEAMCKMLELSELEAYYETIRLWTNMDSITVPEGLNIITKKLQPVGRIVIDWTRDEVDKISLFFLALRCGNQITITIEQDNEEQKVNAKKLVEALSTIIPEGVLKIFEPGSDGGKPDGNFAISSRNDYMRPIITRGTHPMCIQNLLWQFLNTQYIWMPEIQSS